MELTPQQYYLKDEQFLLGHELINELFYQASLIKAEVDVVLHFSPAEAIVNQNGSIIKKCSHDEKTYFRKYLVQLLYIQAQRHLLLRIALAGLADLTFLTFTWDMPFILNNGLSVEQIMSSEIDSLLPMSGEEINEAIKYMYTLSEQD